MSTRGEEAVWHVILMVAFNVAWFSAFQVRNAEAQSYPAKPIRIIAPGVGGAGDFAARLIAQGLSAQFAQQVMVDNRGGITAAETASKSAPDGYTLLLHGSTIWLTPLLQDNTPYDPQRDLAPVSWTNQSPNLLVVHPSLPVHSVKELIALAKAQPGVLNYSSGSVGGSSFLAPELFKSLTRVNLVRIGYKSDRQEITDLLSGEVHLTFGALAALTPFVKTGRLRALAVTSAKRSPLFPELSTIDAAGVPGYEAISILGVWVPTGTPAAIVQTLNGRIVRVLNQPEIRERFLNTGVEIVGSSPEEFAAKIRGEIVKWRKIFEAAGIKAQ